MNECPAIDAKKAREIEVKRQAFKSRDSDVKHLKEVADAEGFFDIYISHRSKEAIADMLANRYKMRESMKHTHSHQQAVECARRLGVDFTEVPFSKVSNTRLAKQVSSKNDLKRLSEEYGHHSREVPEDSLTTDEIRKLVDSGGFTEAEIALFQQKLGHLKDRQKRNLKRKEVRWQLVDSTIGKMRSDYERMMQSNVQSKEKVVGVVVGLIDRGLFRIGNETSSKRDDTPTYGVSVFKPEHAKLDRSSKSVTFTYPGKKNVPQEKSIQNTKIFNAFAEVKDWEEKHPCRDANGERKLFCYNAGTPSNPKSVPLQGKDISDFLDRYTTTDPELGEVGVNPHIFRSFHANRILREQMAGGKTYEQALRVVAEELGHKERTKDGQWRLNTKTAQKSYLSEELVSRYGSGRTANNHKYKIVKDLISKESGDNVSGWGRTEIVEYLRRNPESRAWEAW